MKILNVVIFLTVSFLFINFVIAAHFIVGTANNAKDGTSANGRTVVIWNPGIGMNDNITDIIGASGNSETNNVYFLDCELLNRSCTIGDNISIMINNFGDRYFSRMVSINVTGAGFDVAPNMTLNSPPIILNMSVEDNILSPVNEIDLNPASTKNVLCNGVISDADGENDISYFEAELFNVQNGSFRGADDNNHHYSNYSCFLNTSYGNSNQTSFSCSFNVQYYAYPGNWNCSVFLNDSYGINFSTGNVTHVNLLLALNISSPVDFGLMAEPPAVSSEQNISISNAGNIEFNLSLSGYALSDYDNMSMNCTIGNISIGYKKYNLTESNPGSMNLASFESLYQNLSSVPINRKFDLINRDSDVLDDTVRKSFWRIYVPSGVDGACEGYIVFGAVRSEGS